MARTPSCECRFSAFTIGAPEVQFVLDVAIQRCRSASGTTGNATPTASGSAQAADGVPQTCIWDLLKLGPAKPGACLRMTSLGTPSATQTPSPRPTGSAGGAPGTTGGPGASGASDPSSCDVGATLVGDFASYSSPPDLSSKLLFVPTICNNFVSKVICRSGTRVCTTFVSTS